MSLARLLADVKRRASARGHDISRVRLARCPEVEREHAASARQFMHVGCGRRPAETVCVAEAASRLSDEHVLGLLVHEVGHVVLRRLRREHTEAEANEAGEVVTGVAVVYRGPLWLEWARLRAMTRDDYVKFQTETFMSHEADQPVWREVAESHVAQVFAATPRDARVLVVACGDGVELAQLRRMGFSRVVGVEFCRGKAERARGHGFQVREDDMHDMQSVASGETDVAYSSHTIEHAMDPDRVVRELARVLRPRGRLHVVLPYTDRGDERAHCGSAAIGLRDDGGGDDARQVACYERIFWFFTSRGFRLLDWQRDGRREPELRMDLEREA